MPKRFVLEVQAQDWCADLCGSADLEPDHGGVFLQHAHFAFSFIDDSESFARQFTNAHSLKAQYGALLNLTSMCSGVAAAESANRPRPPTSIL